MPAPHVAPAPVLDNTQPECRGLSAGLSLQLTADTAGMAKKPEPPRPIRWNVYKVASNGVWLCEVEAPDEGESCSGI
jgi:hypothetical protein